MLDSIESGRQLASDLLPRWRARLAAHHALQEESALASPAPQPQPQPEPEPELEPEPEPEPKREPEPEPKPEPEPELLEPEPEPEPLGTETGALPEGIPPQTLPTAVAEGPSSLLVPLTLEQREFDFFLNHCQASGQDQCGSLARLLQAAGCRVWYDMQAQDLTAQGMEDGVANSRNVLIFLSDGVMGRPFCNAEQRWGKKYGCHFVGVVEKDERHGGGPTIFAQEMERAPVDLKHLLVRYE